MNSVLQILEAVPKRIGFVFLVIANDVLAAQNAAEEQLEEIIVYGRSIELVGVSNSASSGIVGLEDIQVPPLHRVGELVEAVPGMVATQHSGTGKANQYFLRGFNLDHGTDFSVALDGVPLNMRTHGHGQGYLDLNPLIPELVRMTSYQKGPYAPEKGDFYSAGSVDFEYYTEVNESRAEITLGEDGYRRIFAVGSSNGLLAALDLTRYDGPFELSEDLRQDKAHLSYAQDSRDFETLLALDHYDADWNSADQIPHRAVEAGLIGRLGFIDPDLGGSSTRTAFRAKLSNENSFAQVYGVDSDFTLLSNFTYFLGDPTNGDQIEQEDRRRIYGINIGGARVLSSQIDISWGLEIRHDDIQQLGLFATVSGSRLATIRNDEVTQTSYGGYMRFDWQATDRLRVMSAMRADYYRFDVDANLNANSGTGSDLQLSPKLTIAYLFNENLEAYANFGRGMHSNDVRGVSITIDPISGTPADDVPLLVPTTGAELGLRYELGNKLNASLAVFSLEVDSELVFLGDGGSTEANSGSQRYGVELSSFYQVFDWLSLNAAYTLTDASFEGVPSQVDSIPGSIEETMSVGVVMKWTSGLSASFRLRYLGGAPLIEDDSIRSGSSVLANTALHYEQGAIGLKLEVYNVFDSDDADIAYFYESRLPGEPAAGVGDVHFHPLEPRTTRLTFSWSL